LILKSFGKDLRIIQMSLTSKIIFLRLTIEFLSSLILG